MLKIVGLFVNDSEKKKILLINRIKKPYVGYWGILGGKVKDGEESIDAASRELFEESGINATGKYIGKCHEQILENNKMIAEFEIYAYSFITNDVNLNHDSKEGELKWFNLADLKNERIIPSDILMIDGFFNKGFKEVLSIVGKENDNYFQERFEEVGGKKDMIKIERKDDELIIFDSAYGKEIIKEHALIELIDSKPVQRLKEITQYGIPDEYYHKVNYSRFEHSIGVFILLRRLGAGVEEQISGLLHDISHTAFSHVVDWAIGDPTKEDYQDNNHLNIIKNSEIPEILKKYGYDYEKISEVENYSLLESPAPGLCADRIDYTLRELNKEGASVTNYLNNLINFNGQVAFKDKEIAKKFAYDYLKLQNEHWAGPQAKIRYYILGNILKFALDKGIIGYEDLYKTDKEVINQMILGNDDFIKENLELLRGELVINQAKENEGIIIKKKFRYIDPEILIEGEIKKVSEVFSDYKKQLDIEKINSNLERRYIYHGICS
jgi:uncharacterized protein